MTAKTDWVAVERDYLETRKSVREIGRTHSISEAAIRKRAKAGGWVRPDMKKVRTAHREIRTAAVALSAPSGEPEDLLSKGREIVGRLMDELSSVTTNIGELEEMIFAETADDDSDKRRDAMLKAVSLGSRAGVARNLATAFKTLQESGVGGGAKGKKEQAQEAAQEIAASGKFAPRRAPKLVVNNTK